MDIALRIFEYIKSYKKRAALAVLCMLIHSFVTVFFVRVFQELIETIISGLAEEGEGFTVLTMIAAAMLIVYFIKGVVYYFQKYLSKYVSHRVMLDIRNDLYAHLQRLSLSFYNQHKTGELISRLTNDVKVVQKALIKTTVTFIYKLFTVIGGIIYLLYLNVRLTLFLLIVLPAVAYIIKVFNTKIRRVSRRAQVKIADVSDVIQETVSSMRVIKSFGREDYEYQRFSESNEGDFKARLKGSQYKAMLSPLVEFVASIAFTIILWYGGLEVLRGNMAASELIAFFTMLLAMTGPIKSLSQINAKIQKALAAGERIFETLDYDDIITPPQSGLKPETIEGQVVFDDVSFAYREDERVLKNINLEVEPGEAIALVGPSGAGKSTLVDLIPRFYDPTEGEVRLDGNDVRELDMDWLRANIGIVPQETVLFSGTIQENIAYGNFEAGEKEIKEAARAANAHHFISEFPDGYETRVGERGAGLSGGQQQRVAIARALLKDPKILIFDEATSSLDAESEQMVQDALARLMEDRTTFIIAHRLSTIINVNNIVVLEDGRMIERGDHETLIDRDDKYASLYRNQLLKEQTV
ncbi:ABC transporter ATP-binding protein [Halarsenatibacter silvermanii]|uniref:ATP-binding cassette, subfamily B, MsbA n=1 Tax=Halarsenatibacter silvermanii TaxID=321763 RepID=A0A1G9I0Z8_9FIRM|nr:ABC transporter ATP-binding protein [Halarsenatibacter silvermanii]SDL18907.1 ATP-binding cassette, subfamily B, MsbA [Halarsenatibacter silvermanii]